MRKFTLLILGLALFAVTAPPAQSEAADTVVVTFSATTTTGTLRTNWIRQPCTASNGNYSCAAGQGGELLNCEALHAGKTMAMRVTDATASKKLLDYMRPPTGMTERYVSTYTQRNPPKPGYTKFRGQRCEDGCFAEPLTASVGQDWKCEVQPP